MMAAAEERLVWLRVVVAVFGAALLLLLPSELAVRAPLAHVLAAFAPVYAVLLLVFRPWRHEQKRWNVIAVVTDAALVYAWLWATGGFHSPFHVMLYPLVIAFAFRFPAWPSLAIGTMFAALYAGFAVAEGVLWTHTGEVIIRVTIVILSGGLGAIIASEALMRSRRLAEAVNVRDEFLSVASHELRTPVSALSLRLAVLQKAASLGPEHVERAMQGLDRATRQTDRLAQLVNDLLDASRISGGELVLDTEDCDLAEIAAEVAADLQLELERAGCVVHVLGTGDTRGRWSRSRVDQVLTNLVSNAMKYGPGQPIDVTISGKGDRVLVQVRDRGVGIAACDHERVFERFERSSAWRNYGGLGLGLYISQQIVRSHGGHIHIEDVQGDGTQFCVSLPRDSSPESRLPLAERQRSA